MMEATSVRRRALAPRDANAQTPALKSMSQASPVKAQVLCAVLTTAGNKRSLTLAEEPAPKRQRTPRQSQEPWSSADDALARQQRVNSTSPEPSSIFDHSTIDASQATCATEPDAEANAPSPPPRTVRRPTIPREEARQKAEILRLRLGLAQYKLRTGQENVPLERLQVRRVPDNSRREPNVAPLSQNRGRRETWPTSLQVEGQKQLRLVRQASSLSAAPPEKKSMLPRLPSTSFNTPTRTRFDEEGSPSSSAIKGGAAKGLLSLSRG